MKKTGFCNENSHSDKLLIQLFKFAIVGTIAAGVDIGLLLLLKEILNVYVLLSSAISFCASVIVNYILSMTFVFKSHDENKIREFTIFVALSVGGLLLNQLILWVGINLLSIYYLIVKFLAMLIVPIYNFVTRKMILEAKEK